MLDLIVSVPDHCLSFLLRKLPSEMSMMTYAIFFYPFVALWFIFRVNVSRRHITRKIFLGG